MDEILQSGQNGTEHDDLVVRGQRINSFRLEGKLITRPITFEDCFIDGMQLLGCTFAGNVMFEDCAFDSVIRLVDCKFEANLGFCSSNMVFTELVDTSVGGELVLCRSRFTKLFDISKSNVRAIDLTDAIILETFHMDDVLPLSMRMNGATVNGTLSENFTDDWEAARAMLVGSNDASGLATMRDILEKEMKYRQADDLFVHQKRAERTKQKGASGILSDISYVMGGYGMKPQYTLCVMLGLILLFAAVYALVGTPFGVFPEMGVGHLDALYLSVDSFFTVGQSDFSEDMSLIRTLSLVEGVTGVFLMFYFTVLLTRKIVR